MKKYTAPELDKPEGKNCIYIYPHININKGSVWNAHDKKGPNVS